MPVENPKTRANGQGLRKKGAVGGVNPYAKI